MPDQQTLARLNGLAARIAGRPAAVEHLERLSGGASQETWSFDIAGEGRRQPAILRRRAKRFPGDAALSMAGEAASIRAAAARGVPVPEILHVLAPEDGLGEGFVSARVEGEALGHRICRAPELAPLREVFAARCGEILAAIHAAVPPAELEPVPPALAFERIEASMATLPDPRPVFALALAWLEANMAEPWPAPVLVHGDYRNGNLIVGAEGVRAVLDWEAAHIGDPHEDLAWMCLPSWRFGRHELAAGGVGRGEDFEAAYARASGIAIEPPRLRFWTAMGMLRWGVMCAAAAVSFAKGDDASPERAVIARRASEAEIDLLRLLAPRERAA